MQGLTSAATVGYMGPAPPRGPVHHYRFRLYALDAVLPLGRRLTKAQLLAAMKGHILAEVELVGTYQR
jgi:Raf kinase inhibitor-like YbhB/YbcL family protein